MTKSKVAKEEGLNWSRFYLDKAKEESRRLRLR